MGGREDGWIWEQQVYISTKGAILRFARVLILEGFPGPRRGPQIVPWAAEERVPELALVHNHTDEYFAYHHRTFMLASALFCGYPGPIQARAFLNQVHENGRLS